MLIFVGHVNIVIPVDILFPNIHFYVFKSSDDERLHSKKLQIARYHDPAVSNLNVRIIFRGVPPRTRYLLQPDSPPRKGSVRGIDKNARLYNRKAYPIPDFQIIRCYSMPCGTFWKWIDPFESNLINTKLYVLIHGVVDTEKVRRYTSSEYEEGRDVRKPRIVMFRTICLLPLGIPVNVTYVKSRAAHVIQYWRTSSTYSGVRCIFKLSLTKENIHVKDKGGKRERQRFPQREPSLSIPSPSFRSSCISYIREKLKRKKSKGNDKVLHFSCLSRSVLSARSLPLWVFVIDARRRLEGVSIIIMTEAF